MSVLAMPVTSPAVSIETFREAMSRWGTGVTVISAAYDGQCHGMVASSFTSVSADPFTVLFCADHRTRTYAAVKASGAFAVNILSQDQEDTFQVFAGRTSRTGDQVADKFMDQDTLLAATGSPILNDSLAWFDCRVVAEYPGGNTHSIFVGEVIAADLDAGPDQRPLLYFNRQLRQLQSE